MDLDGVIKSLDVELFTVAGTKISAATLLVVVAVLLGTLVASWVLQRALAKALSLRGADQGTTAVFQRLVHYVVILLGIFVALDTLGVNLAALFAAGAVFAFGIGFAMKNIVENFVSGVILLVERSITPGDIIEINDLMVRVDRLGIRATLCRTLDEEEIIVPNSTVVQATVKNYTLRDSLYRLRARVGVTYDSDLRVVRDTLESVAAEMPWRQLGKAPIVLLLEFGDSAVVYEVGIWIDDPWSKRRARSDLHEAVWWAFKEQGIVIAFPQLDVHFDDEVLPALARAG